MTKLLTRTSVTKDEAIAYLLKIIDGPVTFEPTEPNWSEEAQDAIDSLKYSISEELEDRLDMALEAYVLARDDNRPTEEITALRVKVNLAKRYIKLANDVRIALSHELLAPTSALRIDTNLSASGLLYITLESVRLWAKSNSSVASVQLELDGICAMDKGTEQLRNDRNQPWWQVDHRDPKAESDWYTPARYFARLLVRKDPSLLEKRGILATKIQAELQKVEVYKRGGKVQPSQGSIKNALSNVNLID